MRFDMADELDSVTDDTPPLRQYVWHPTEAEYRELGDAMFEGLSALPPAEGVDEISVWFGKNDVEPLSEAEVREQADKLVASLRETYPNAKFAILGTNDRTW
jgi:ParB-like chromosome segregation protein Spo0J